MRKRARTVRQILRCCRGTRWGFQILYKLLGVTLLVPLLFRTLDFTIWVTGYNYLTFENIGGFFRNPLVYLCLLLIIFLVCLFAAFDISAMLYIMHCSMLGQKTHVIFAMRFAAHNIAAMFRKGGRGLFLTVLLMLPFFSVSQVPELLATYSVPNMLLLNLRHTWIYVTAGLVLMLLLMIPISRRLYSMVFFTLEGKSSREARKCSRALGKGYHAQDLFLLLLTQVICYGMYLILLGIGLFGVVLFGRTFAKAYIVSGATVSLLKIVITVLIVLFGMVGTPVCTMLIYCLYYYHKVKKGEKVPDLDTVHRQKGCSLSDRERKWREKNKKLIFLGQILILAGTIGACSYYIYQMHKGELNLNIEYLKGMQVTAHRGASRYYPENTMSAFQGAVESQADWIELDVQESSDGQIFVMHDNNFKRTAGVRAYAWELSYDEISKLDAGSHHSSRFAGEKIPLLTEAIALAKENDIRLNIEIKPAPQQPDLEERLVEILHEEDFVSKCVVTSQAYESIRKVKQLDEEIQTVYVMSFAYGNINRLKYADAFSVRSSSVTDTLVRVVHNAGKEIYAWTVNTRDAINLMIDRRVDNIITDDVPLAKKCIGRKLTSNSVNDYIDLLNRQFRIGSYRIWNL